MNKIDRIILIMLILVAPVGFQSCYEKYDLDFEYQSVYFGSQKPLRTLVTRLSQDELVFKIGVALGGVRENKKGYEVKYALDTTLFSTVEGANNLKLLPKDCYTINNNNDFSFYIPKGKVIGDCEIKINKDMFVSLPGSLDQTWALPFKLVSTTADTILENKNWTIVVINYIDEHSGSYFCRGSQDEWNGTEIIDGTTISYIKNDWSKNVVRQLTTLSPYEFDMSGMGNINSSINPTDHLLIKLVDGEVVLKPLSSTTNDIIDLGSTYDAQEKMFTLKYIYTKGATSYQVNEELKLRQDVEKELRYTEWVSN